MKIVSKNRLSLPAVIPYTSHRSYYWTRQLKAEEQRERSLAIENYSSKVTEIEICLEVWKRVDYPHSTEVRKVFESKILQLKDHPGISTGSEGLPLLRRLCKVQYQIVETCFGFENGPASKLINDSLAAKIQEEQKDKFTKVTKQDLYRHPRCQQRSPKCEQHQPRWLYLDEKGRRPLLRYLCR